MITYKQLTLAEVFEDCQNKFDNDKYQFLSLLDDAIHLDEIVPVSFVSHFHARTGRPRKHQLYPMLKALLIQRIFSIPTDMLLIVFLKYSQELRDFCGFDVVPDASKFTRFKQDFLSDLQSMFDHMVDLTEPICQKLDSALASMIIFDTSGIEAWVTENNPKYANRMIKQLKAFKKSHNLDDSYDPYKAAYGSMPSHAASNQAIRQMYINGHFCYAYKFGIITNGLGIVRDITFYNKDFLHAHPDIVVEKKSDSPDEDQSLADSKALLPVLIDFFQKHPLIEPKTFPGDAAFDTVEIYKSLFGEIGFHKAFIPLRGKLSMEENGCTFNENGIPCCPHDPSLPRKREGSKSHLRSKLPTMKFVCPKMKWEYNPVDKSKRRVCHCDNPCTTSSCGRMIYVYPEKNLRAYPGAERGSKEWEETYKLRVSVEKSINHFKDSFCIANRKTQNEKTLHADLLLAGITPLVTVMTADKIHQHQYIRSLKPLIA
ncbi:transposase [Lachnospiraceae bacterium 47-T17]